MDYRVPEGRPRHGRTPWPRAPIGALVPLHSDLRSLELARGVLASAQKCSEFGSFGLAQFNPVAYIDLYLLFIRGTDEQLIGWRT